MLLESPLAYPPSLPTPAAYAAEVARAARTTISSTGEGLPAYAHRMGVSYSSLWRLLHGRDVRMKTLQALYQRIVVDGPAARLPNNLQFLGRVTYLRALGFAPAPFMEVGDIPALCVVSGPPSSGKTTLAAMLALGADPLGPSPRIAAAVFGASLAALAGAKSEVMVLGPAGRICTRLSSKPGPDPVRVEVSARVRGADRRVVFGSLRLPSPATRGSVTYVGESPPTPSPLPQSRTAVLAMRSAGWRRGGLFLGGSARRVAAAAAALEALGNGPGLVLLDADFPPPSLPFLVDLSRQAVAGGSQVVFTCVSPDPFRGTGVEVICLHRNAKGCVRGILRKTCDEPPGAEIKK